MAKGTESEGKEKGLGGRQEFKSGERNQRPKKWIAYLDESRSRSRISKQYKRQQQ